MKTLKLMALSLSLFFCVHTFATPTAPVKPYYGHPASATAQYDQSINITNNGSYPAIIGVLYSQGFRAIIPIMAARFFPFNIVTIPNSAPYVTIQITSMMGTILYPKQAVYPGQYITINAQSN